ncbi:MAG: glycosyltransferase family 39 protein [Syntrophobacteraceae bacterium]
MNMWQCCSVSRLPITWGIIITGALVYFIWGNTHEGIWLDESFSAAFTNRPLPDILGAIKTYDSHPPLYYLALGIFRKIFGNSLSVLRAFSALGTVSMLALGAGPIRRAFGAGGGIIFAVLVFAAPFNLVYAQEARMYSWAAFSVTACIAYGYLAIEKGKTSDWAKFGILAVCAAYTHYCALLAVTIAGLLMAIWITAKKRERLAPFLLTAAAALFLFLPWLRFPLGTLRHGSSISWIPKLTWDIVVNVLEHPFGYKFSVNNPPQALITFLWIFVMALWGIYTGISKRKKEVEVSALALLTYAINVGFLIIASIIYRPLLTERYIVPILGLLLLSAAYAWTLLPVRGQALSCLLLLLLCLPQAVAIRRQQFNGPMNEASKYINSDLRPGDVFLHNDWHTMGTFSFSFPNNKHFVYCLDSGNRENYEDPVFGHNVMSGPDLEGFIKGKKNIWLVGRTGSSDVWMVQGKIKVEGEKRTFTQAYSWYGVWVERVEP